MFEKDTVPKKKRNDSKRKSGTDDEAAELPGGQRELDDGEKQAFLQFVEEYPQIAEFPGFVKAEQELCRNLREPPSTAITPTPNASVELKRV